MGCVEKMVNRKLSTDLKQKSAIPALTIKMCTL